MKAFVGMGSNRGDRRRCLDAAARELDALPGTRVVELSSVYATRPVGDPDQPPFLNMVACVDTDLEAEELLRLLLAVERGHGRPPGARRGPRALDLDLLYYGDRVIDSPRLTVPHPRAQERLFVLVPMAELEPSWTDPRTGLRVDALLRARGTGSGTVRWAGRLTAGVARERTHGGGDDAR